MKKIIQYAGVCFLFLLSCSTLKAATIEASFTDIVYNAGTQRYEFLIKIKKGNDGSYTPLSSTGDFSSIDFRFDICAETGVTFAGYGTGTTNSKLGTLPVENLSAGIKLANLDITNVSMNNYNFPATNPNADVTNSYVVTILRTSDFVAGSGKDLDDEWVVIAKVSLYATSGTPTSATKIKLRTLDRYASATTRIAQWGNGYGASQQPFHTPQADYSLIAGPATAVWTGNASTGSKTNWLNPGNWTTDPEGLIPGAATDVTIPGGLTNYPVLTQAMAAECNTIDFKQGAEVAGTHYLKYNSAKVDLQIPNSQWYMVAPPLRSMYSGDYWLGESSSRRNPSISMMKYQAVNPQYTSIPVEAGEWSNTFNTLDVELTPGLGYATFINLNEKASNGSYTFSFPKDSTVYYYYNRDSGDKKNTTAAMDRTNIGKFIYEGTTGWTSGSADGAFNLPVENGTNTAYSRVLITNPFMSHLDVTKLYQANMSKLTGVFTLWTGDDGSGTGTYDAYSYNEVNVVSSTGVPLVLAPMQSIWAERVGTNSFSTLTMNANMSVTAPGEILRSGTMTENELVLNVLRAGNRQSSVLIRYKANASNSYRQGEDAQAFFVANLENKPAMIYAEVDKKALSVNTLSELSKEIDLVISTSEKGWLTLEASGMESFSDPNAKFILLDKWTGGKIDLSKTPSYTFENRDGNLEGRFTLKIENAAMGSDDLSGNSIQIRANENQIRVSASDNLKSVEVYSLQGQLIAKKVNLNVTETTFTVLQKSTVIVKVITQNSQKVEKLNLN